MHQTEHIDFDLDWIKNRLELLDERDKELVQRILGKDWHGIKCMNQKGRVWVGHVTDDEVNPALSALRKLFDIENIICTEIEPHWEYVFYLPNLECNRYRLLREVSYQRARWRKRLGVI